MTADTTFDPSRTPPDTGPITGFSGTQSAAIVAMGVVAGCITALQPILLGALKDQGRLATAQMGHAATAELLGMAISVTIAALAFKPEQLTRKAVIAVLIAIFANLSTGFAEGAAIIGLRGLNGLCSGVMLWILVGFMARATTPGRTFAIYVTVQAALAFLLSLLLTRWLVPAYGASAGFGMLTLLDCGLLAAVTVMPRAYTPTAAGNTGGWPPLAGMIALIGVACSLAAVMAFWVYVLPTGHQLGHPDNSLNLAVSAAIGVQIAGGLAAAFLATRLRPLAACLIGGGVIMAAVWMFLNLSGEAILFASLASFSFCWMFVPPFQMPLLIQVDPSLRSAMLIGTAQLLGSATGPLLASRAVTEHDTSPAATVALGCMVAGLILMVLATWIAKSDDRS